MRPKEINSGAVINVNQAPNLLPHITSPALQALSAVGARGSTTSSEKNKSHDLQLDEQQNHQNSLYESEFLRAM